MPPECRVFRPRWLGRDSWAWVSRVLEDYRDLAGESRAVLDARLRTDEAIAPDRASFRRVRRVLDAQFLPRRVPTPEPAELRRRAFVLAATLRRSGERDVAARCLATLAHSLHQTAEHVEQSLLADLAAEQRLVAPAVAPIVADVAAEANLALLTSMAACSEWIRLHVAASARRVVAAIRASRLIAVVDEAPATGIDVTLSGPLSALRRTTLYGRRLAQVVRALVASADWRLRMRCLFAGSAWQVEVSHLDAAFPRADRSPARFDSTVEERFFRRFTRLKSAWTLEREAQPRRAGARWLFPDFLAVPHGVRERSIPIEIVGFWTPRYLERKLAGLREAQLGSHLLAIDETLQVVSGDVPADASVVLYRGVPNAVQILEGLVRIDLERSGGARGAT